MMSRMILPMTALAVAIAWAPAVAGQDAAAIKKGESVYGAQKCQTCHAIAGKGSKNNPLDGVGKKLTADEIRQWIKPDGNDGEDQVDQEAADAGQIRQSAGRGRRRARRLHGEPEVGARDETSKRSLDIRSRSPAQ